MGLSLDDHFDAESKEAAVKFAKKAADLLLPQVLPLLTWDDELENAFKQASWLVAGVAILSDWIGSSIVHFPYHPGVMALSEYWVKHSLPQAEVAVKASGILPPPPSRSTGVAALFPNIEEPSPLQKHASSCELPVGPQLFILEEATASGKTEAALTLAHRLMVAGLAEGIFMALPTMATANAMFKRVSGAYRRMYQGAEPPSLVLAHSARQLSPAFRESIGLEHQNQDLSYASDDETASAHCATWLADNRKKALLAAVGVGTVDQALLAVLPRRHQSLRLLGLARSVLIVDEVHAYDPYMHALLCKLLRFHAAQGGSAILLSATLPQCTRQELAESFVQNLGISSPLLEATDYPLATHVSAGVATETRLECRKGTRRTVTVEMVHDEETAEQRLREEAERGNCACWIRNTVDDAVSAYLRLTAGLAQERVMLFHARFAMGDRLEIEEEVLRRFGKESKAEERSGKILIATQVVEQSLDLDFDFMVTDLAPIDLIIQRAGRLHRHPRGERGTPTLVVLAPPLNGKAHSNWYAELFPRAAYVYPSHGQLWLTARLLADNGQFTIPDDARYLVEGVFGVEHQDRIPEGLRGRDSKAEGDAKAAISVAQLNALELDAGYASTLNQWLEDTITPTRLSVPTTTVRLARWNGSELLPWFTADRFAWDLSQVSVRKALIAGPAQHGGRLRAAVERATEAMPDRGKWSVLVPLSPGENGNWHGRVSGSKGEVNVIYEPKTGIRVSSSRTD
jgi:CRISPR-associated endonuclease/helicase Cas3